MHFYDPVVWYGTVHESMYFYDRVAWYGARICAFLHRVVWYGARSYSFYDRVVWCGARIYTFYDRDTVVWCGASQRRVNADSDNESIDSHLTRKLTMGPGRSGKCLRTSSCARPYKTQHRNQHNQIAHARKCAVIAIENCVSYANE